jgi:glucose-6-phosphate 1-epimerase
MTTALESMVISTPEAEGEIYLQGAHVARWTPRGERPVLFLSSKSAFEPGKAIRGGVPVIFPWFGPRSDGKPGPAHGLARTAFWEQDGEAFRLKVEQFQLRFVVKMGSTLEMSLEVTNEGSAEARFEEALHTYLAVGDVRQVSVTGLENVDYLDKTDGFKRKLQNSEPFRLTKATDSVYLNTTATCEVTDPVWNRRIVVAKTGSASTVVWNPWTGMADLGPDEWQGMICVETANVGENALTLQAGGTHGMTATIHLKH